MIKKGKVYLVGAGPGDPELLTKKAERIIKEADVILCDALVSEDIKKLFGLGVKLVDVGKRADDHTLPQKEINALLVKYAKEGNVVARLKGGDPYVFGRGGEEAQELRENGVEVEVVPGISSAIAAPAYAGIPITHRGLASSVTIITGHEEPGKGESAIDFSALAGIGGTIVILMGIKRLGENVAALVEAGKPLDTPVAIVENGTTPQQRLTIGTLGSIVDIAAKRNVKAPAVIVVGDVVRLSMKKVAVTRPKVFLKDTVEHMRSKGFEAVPVPMMEMVPRKDGEVELLFDGLNNFDAVIFTSQNGVRFVSDVADIKKLNAVEVFAIGPKTKAALASRGIEAAAMPSTFSSEGLVKDFCGRLANKKVALLRSDHGSPVLLNGLRECGASVKDIVVYDIVPLSGKEQEDFVRQALTGSIDAYTFTSTMTAKSFFMMAESMGVLTELKAAINEKKVAVIGNPTAGFLKENGIRVDVLPERFTFEDMIDGLLKII